MKQCARCRKWKDDTEFNWRWKALGIRQPICRECSKEVRRKHYEAHQEQEKKRSYQRTKDKREAAQRFLYEFLSDQVCADCKTYDFTVLTFDHVRGKKVKDISRMVANGDSIDAIKREIAKCDVVCANCHMIREQQRKGRKRFEKYWPRFPEDYEKWRDEDKVDDAGDDPHRS